MHANIFKIYTVRVCIYISAGQRLIASKIKVFLDIIQPQIRKSWDSMKTQIKKKVVISKFTLTCISLQTI